MMDGWNYGNGAMNFGYGFGAYGFFSVLFWLIVFVDLALLGVWLWKQVQKK